MSKAKTDPKPGHVNLKMLAEHLQLSQTTISLVLNNSPSANSIPHETRQRVLETIEKLGYRPNAAARSLRTSRAFMFGLFIPDFANPVYAEIIKGAEMAAEPDNWTSVPADYRGETLDLTVPVVFSLS